VRFPYPVYSKPRAIFPSRLAPEALGNRRLIWLQHAVTIVRRVDFFCSRRLPTIGVS